MLIRCNKSILETLNAHPGYWNRRILDEFGVSSQMSSKDTTIHTYFQQSVLLVRLMGRYSDWYHQQQANWKSVEREESATNMLINSVSWGRLLYFYETWIAFVGLGITLFLFTLLMMLYLTHTVPFHCANE